MSNHGIWSSQYRFSPTKWPANTHGSKLIGAYRHDQHITTAAWVFIYTWRCTGVTERDEACSLKQTSEWYVWLPIICERNMEALYNPMTNDLNLEGSIPGKTSIHTSVLFVVLTSLNQTCNWMNCVSFIISGKHLDEIQYAGRRYCEFIYRFVFRWCLFGLNYDILFPVFLIIYQWQAIDRENIWWDDDITRE